MKAEEYKKLASAKQVTEEVTLPSGAIFKMRVAPIQNWVQTGVLPASLTYKMQVVAQAKAPEEAAQIVIETFTEEDYVAQQTLSRKLLEFCCVEPKISVGGDDPDALQPEDITPDDFQFLSKWVWSGGKAGESLETFRKQPGKRAVGRSNGAAVQH